MSGYEDDSHDEGLDYLLETNSFEDTNGNRDYPHSHSLSASSHHFPAPTPSASTNILNYKSTTETPSQEPINTDTSTTPESNATAFAETGDIEKDAESLRVSMELEFIQCLANPRYLHFLAQQRYFQDPAFINYLKYLLYWKKPEYAKFIVYPHCLFFLDRLQEEGFRKELINATFVELLWRQQFNHWRYYKLHRTAAPPTEETTQMDASQIPTPPQPH